MFTSLQKALKKVSCGRRIKFKERDDFVGFPKQHFVNIFDISNYFMEYKVRKHLIKRFQLYILCYLNYSESENLIDLL